MFNKSPLPSRPEPVTRRDVRSVLSSTSPSPTSATSAQGTSAPADLTTRAAASATSPGAPASATPPEAATQSATPSSHPEDSLGAKLIVGPDVKLKGAEILDCDTLVVEGRVEATMDSRVIRIADSGAFAGKVSIDIAEIHGHFEGELTARSQLIIHATGRVSGKIRYGKLVIDEGGELSGEIRSLAEPAPQAAILPQADRESPRVPVLTAAVGS